MIDFDGKNAPHIFYLLLSVSVVSVVPNLSRRIVLYLIFPFEFDKPIFANNLVKRKYRKKCLKIVDIHDEGVRASIGSPIFAST